MWDRLWIINCREILSIQWELQSSPYQLFGLLEGTNGWERVALQLMALVTLRKARAMAALGQVDLNNTALQLIYVTPIAWTYNNYFKYTSNSFAGLHCVIETIVQAQRLCAYFSENTDKLNADHFTFVLKIY